MSRRRQGYGGQAGSSLIKKGKTVFVAMSGGVDSSVAALLLKRQGYDVVGVFMRCYNIDGCAETDAEDARRVAERIGIPFYAWDFEEEYKKRVVEYMVEGYRKGITPNPDVMCNREIKFGLFLKRALAVGADYVATGHYVALRNTNQYEYTKEKNSSSYIRKKFIFRSLFQAKDKNKDQSYFLWTLTQDDLRHCLFPIGDYTKPQVRAMARRAGLPTAEKKDSQGICFLGKVSLADFLGRYIPVHRGALVGLNGKKIGEHRGAAFYTIGQRHGLGRMTWDKRHGTRGDGDTKPLYVAEKNVKKNIVTVAEGDDPALYKKEITLTDLNFINLLHHPYNLPPSLTLWRAGGFLRMMKTQKVKKQMEQKRGKGIGVLARVRYRQPLAPATLILSNSRELENKATRAKKEGKGRMGLHASASGPRLRTASDGQARWSAMLVFEHAQKFVAPGQSAVLYSKSGEMLGGGVIVK